MVLGMHRSGTSLLSGLLTTGFGYNIGNNQEDIMQGNPNNPMGYFERADFMYQNDIFFTDQNQNRI